MAWVLGEYAYLAKDDGVDQSDVAAKLCNMASGRSVVTLQQPLLLLLLHLFWYTTASWYCLVCCTCDCVDRRVACAPTSLYTLRMHVLTIVL
jgi:hypothetical protein